ncbi:MAG: alpha/beta hydrolase [Saccharospirillaceae bacterium]|nr:alpha/beta hydrolase [Pseudomonadales bacterium]NRB80492.1 alpha/beta hydrolase [Saccharospirillaceae bacterium]
MIQTSLVMTHGAGAPIDSLVLKSFQNELKKQDFNVHAFNFPYMQKIIQLNKRRPPERVDKLKIQFADQIKPSGESVCIAGKSMGGRVATLLAADREYDHLNIKFVFVWGYPFFAPKKDTARTEHFKDIRAQVHIFQGTRDSFGKPDQIAQLNLPENIHIHWIDGADHDFKILKRLNISTEQSIIDICKKMTNIVKKSG